MTVGGGGDGADLMHQVIAAHDHDPTLDWPVVMVLGPFMKAEERDELRRRAASHQALHLIDFDNRPEILMENAAGVVAMGGYNTFCEILSLDKRALIVPRVRPREEQLIRARRAAALGLVDCILPGEAADPARPRRGATRAAPPHRAVARALHGPTSTGSTASPT